MIRYHGLPMWPKEAMIRAMYGRHGMVSYERPEQIEIAAEVCQSIVLDNGAFSAWKSGEPHDFQGYQRWCAHWLKHPAVEWCVIPDVIDGSEGENDELLLAWQLPRALSVPVWHLHEDLRRLRVLSERYNRVALGSSGEYAEPGDLKWWSRMSEVMAAVCDADGLPRVKLHGLRMLDPVVFSHIPLSSADSCNVARNLGYDCRWDGPYTPRSKAVRALVLIDRIEHHASASRWNPLSAGVQQNLELFG
jgi:hypothetical protein